MKKIYILMVGIALSVASQSLLAQHSGHSMGGMGTGSSGANDSAMRDMQRSMAVQATEEQSMHLRSWIQSTLALSKQVDQLRGLVAGKNTSELSSALSALKTGLGESAASHDEFLKSLSAPQRSGLKKPVRKLEKINGALVASSAALLGTAGQSQNVKQLAATLQKTKKSIEELQQQQQQLANEMGAKS